jgi:hypothetical protein
MNVEKRRFIFAVLSLLALGLAAGLLLGLANGVRTSPAFLTDEKLVVRWTYETDPVLKNKIVVYLFERQGNERSALLPLAMVSYIRLGRLAEFRRLFKTFRDEGENIGAYYGYIVMWAEELEKIGQPELANACIDLLARHVPAGANGATSMDLYCMRLIAKASVLGIDPQRADEAIDLLNNEVLSQTRCGEQSIEAARRLLAKILERRRRDASSGNSPR